LEKFLPHFDTDLLLGEFFPSFEELKISFLKCHQLMLNLFLVNHYGRYIQGGKKENKKEKKNGMGDLWT
jgi:hypothetical protein